MSSTNYVDGVTPLDAVHMNALQQKVEKAAANGYPSLDATGKVPASQLPAISSVDYAGAYNPATTYHAGEFVVGADGVTYQCVKDGTVGITPTPWAPAPSVPYGTNLPLAPVDGQEAVLVDSITVPTYRWRFRYNAGNTSAYKWEFVGGAPWMATEATTLTLANAWVARTPVWTAPRAGVYQTDAGHICADPTAGALVGLSAGPIGLEHNVHIPGNGFSQASSAAQVLTVAQGGTVAVTLYSSTGASTSGNRWLRITPMAVA